MLSTLPQETTPSTPSTLWQMGFRPFFLAGPLYAILFMVYWSSGLAGFSSLGSRVNVIFFHIHELMYGFALAIIAGFLLTASANWTRTRGLHGRPLQLLFFFWLLGRAGMWIVLLGGALSWSWLSLFFIPALILSLAPTLFRAKKWQNTAILAWLLLLFLGQAAYVLELSWVWMGHGREGLYLGLHSVIFLLVMIGGRVIPYFTKNALQAQDLGKWERMDLLGLLCLIAYVVASFFWGQSHAITGITALLAGSTNLLRMRHWGTFRTFSKPILWILHISYLWVLSGFFLHAAAIWTTKIPFSASIHAFTVGGIGCFVLGMISRVSLGHTGRPLHIAPITLVAYVLILSAATLRVLTSLLPSAWFHIFVAATGLCWIAAYSLYLIAYWPILTTPRPDGKVG